MKQIVILVMQTWRFNENFFVFYSGTQTTQVIGLILLC